MSKMSRMVHLIAAVSLLSLVLVGCSDDDNGNGGTGPVNTISAEEQFELIDQFIDLDPDTTEEGALGFSILTLGIGEISGAFLDGIDEQDFEGFFLPGLNKAVPSNLVRASVSYGYSNGWWEIQIDSAFSAFGLIYDLSLIDSVRFETAGGEPQQIPGDDTETFIERTNYDLEMSGVFGGQTFNLDMDFATGVDISGLTTATATINGGTSGTFSGGYQSNDTTATFALTVDGSTTNGVVPNFEEGGCVASGSMEIGLGLDANVTTPSGSASAQGTWDVNVTIVNGIATITYESGDVTLTETADLCEEDDE